MELQDRLFSENTGETLYSITMTESEYDLYSEFCEALYSKDSTEKKIAKDLALVAGITSVGAGAGALAGHISGKKGLEELSESPIGSIGRWAKDGVVSEASNRLSRDNEARMIKEARARIQKAAPGAKFEFNGKKGLTAQQYMKAVRRKARVSGKQAAELMADKANAAKGAVEKIATAKRALNGAKKGAMIAGGAGLAAVAAKRLLDD